MPTAKRGEKRRVNLFCILILKLTETRNNNLHLSATQKLLFNFVLLHNSLKQFSVDSSLYNFGFIFILFLCPNIHQR